MGDPTKMHAKKSMIINCYILKCFTLNSKKLSPKVRSHNGAGLAVVRGSILFLQLPPLSDQSLMFLELVNIPELKKKSNYTISILIGNVYHTYDPDFICVTDSRVLTRT